MFMTLPVTLLGLTGLSLSAPTDVFGGGRRETDIRRESGEWVSEPIHETDLSSMKSRMSPSQLVRQTYMLTG
jgi:hypothetical protein